MQIALFAGLVALVIERLRAICAEGPLEVEPFVRALRGLPRDRARELLARARRTFVGQALGPAYAVDPSERDVALEEGLEDARRGITDRLAWLRIGATVSSFLGMVGAAIELGWVYAGDHGLLGLDPSRVQAIGFGRAALSIALGVGGSSFGLGAWLTLRGFARRLVQDCERAVERLRAADRPG